MDLVKPRMRNKAEDIEAISTGLVGPLPSPARRRLELHCHEGGRIGKPTGDECRLVKIVGTGDSVLCRFDCPPVREGECPVKRVVWKPGKRQLGSRYVSHPDPIDLVPAIAPSSPATISTGGRIVAVLRGHSVEVTSDSNPTDGLSMR
jgi:hypothetical protein